MLRALLFFATTALALESSPAPGGGADGGRPIPPVFIRVIALNESIIDSTTVAVPAGGMSAYYAFKRSSIVWDSQSLGDKAVVTVISGVARASSARHDSARVLVARKRYARALTLSRARAARHHPLAESLPKTAWILSHTHAGHTSPNVNLAETKVMPGDELVWRLYQIGKQPKPEPKASAAADEPAPAHEGDDEL